jgi:glycine/D-amino acid oxidase-like deaminating enzyme
MRVAIIGGGLFGCTAAVYAARSGHDVTIYDNAADIMLGATKVNQYRLHKGYHYPRSDKTVQECRNSMASFLREYGDAVSYDDAHFYAIAKGSKTGREAYEAFMDRNELGDGVIEVAAPYLFNDDSLESAYLVSEGRIDYPALLRIVRNNLSECGVQIKTSPPFEARRDYHLLAEVYDKIIVAGYAGTNEIMKGLGYSPIELQYEVIEKPIVKLPEQYANVGCVVMDGPYGCIDPIGSGLHLMGHVEHAIHKRVTGYEAPKYRPDGSNFEKMKDALSEYLPFVSQAQLVRPMYTVRVVLPRKDETDERPTIVQRIDDKVLRIFSGKLGHAVKAAEDSVMMLEEREAA